MTDPIADFLTRLRNANSAYHDEVTLPHSKIKANIAEILKREGYITDYRTEDARVGKALTVQLKYGPSRERSIAGLRRVSKPDRPAACARRFGRSDHLDLHGPAH
jgi:small subunit ribosomal protein S8